MPTWMSLASLSRAHLRMLTGGQRTGPGQWVCDTFIFKLDSIILWPPPLSDLDLTWVSLAFGGTVRHLTPWIVTRIYCCSGSRHRLPSVDCDCNHHLHQAQAETEAPTHKGKYSGFVCPSSWVADCETLDVDVKAVSVSPYYTKISVVIGGKPGSHLEKLADEWRLLD